MFRDRLTIGADSNIDEMLARFSARIQLSALPPPQQSAVFDMVSQLAHEFHSSGTKVAAVGSSFQADRRLSGDGYEVTIAARFGMRPTIGDRLLGLFRRT